MNRRTFLASLMALPFVKAILPKGRPTYPLVGILSTPPTGHPPLFNTSAEDVECPSGRVYALNGKNMVWYRRVEPDGKWEEVPQIQPSKQYTCRVNVRTS